MIEGRKAGVLAKFSYLCSMIHCFKFYLLLLTACLAMACQAHTPRSQVTTKAAARHDTATAASTASFATEQKQLQQWQAGTTVSLKSVEAYGLQRCFMAEKISNRVFARMQGRSYKSYCTVPRSALRYVKVLHYNLKGDICLGELVCHQSISADLVAIFKQLFEAHYPIERMVLIDNYGADDELSMSHNNTSCFNFRYVAGTKVLSNHSQGKAIDINPLYNPMVRKRKDGTLFVSPAAGKPYAKRTKHFKYKIDTADLCYQLFTCHGFKWGGSWRHIKDYQHFEKQ